jgi:tRNA(Ile)-lysidine synthase
MQAVQATDVLSEVHSYISRRGLIEPGQQVVIGVSGGPDSVALLDLLCRLSVDLEFQIHVAHMNHRLRGEASDGDEAFVSRLADTLDLPYHSKAMDIDRRGKSIEEAARDARLEFLKHVLDQTGSHRIALGHSRSDQAETFLLRLFRGAGARGLGAIRPIRDGLWIRPLLDLPRERILAYNRFRKLEFRTDDSNTDRRFSRNRIRHDLLPLLAADFNPSIEEVLARSADILQQEDELMADLTETALEDTLRYRGQRKIILDVTTLFRYHISLRRRILRKVLLWLQFGATEITFKTLHRVLDLLNNSSGTVQISADFCVQKLAGMLVLSRVTPPSETQLVVPGITQIPWLDAAVEVSVRPVSEVVDDLNRLPAFRACFDLSDIDGSLAIRNPRQGDRMKPFGMPGTQKISHFLINSKTPRTLRDQIPLLVDKSSILWAVGLRRARPYPVTSGTREVLDVVFTGGWLTSAALQSPVLR